MQKHIKLISCAISGAALLLFAGCGGGGGSAATASANATTTPITTTVVDGAIRNAVVCLDKNGNGICDADEVQGKTDALGNVTLDVPRADVGKYPILAVVGTDAVDVENGAVTVAYTMSAPADRHGVVSPLTTLVQQTVASTGASTADAAKSVQDVIGVNVSLFDDFTKVAAPTDGSLNAKTFARLMVVTTQAHLSALVSAVGTTAIDGATITKANVDKVVQQKLLELLPTLVAAMANPAMLAAAPAAKEIALAAAAADVVKNVSGLTAASLTTLVAVNNAPAAPAVAAASTSSVDLATLTFTNTSNYFSALITASIAQNTPDAAGNTRYVNRLTRATGAGSIAQWSAGSDPTRNADLHWNGTQWVNCPLNFENLFGPRDAQGSNTYNRCDGTQTGKIKRTSFDIGGKSMRSVYAQVLAAGYTNLSITDPTVLASATFPAGAAMTYQSWVALTNAIVYSPGNSSKVKRYSADVVAGISSACNATAMPMSSVITLEGLISSRTGIPCALTASSGGTPNTWYGNSTLSLGKIGPVASNYIGNTQINVAFQGTGTNPVTYLACQERATDASAINCSVIGTGTYTIATRDDARILTLSNLPAQAAGLPTARVYIERGGFVYSGYQNKLEFGKGVRLNSVASKSLLTQIGIVPADPEVPFALTAASYQGSWDFYDALYIGNGGTNVAIGANGTAVCTTIASASPFACTLTLTNVSTGTFAFTSTVGLRGIGKLDFMTGTGTGTFHDPSSTPENGRFVAQRR